jgi:hypothetical protein
MSIFDDALEKRFTDSTEAVAVTSADTLLIHDNETGFIFKLPVSVLTTAIAAAAPVQSVAGRTGNVTLAKSDVGLSNVDNTSDANKPISTATQMALNGKEASISAGTTAQYWRGDKSWRDFATDVRSAVLTGLSTATNAVITVTDSVLTAFGKLQKQISDNLATLTTHTGSISNPHSVTKSQVGLSNVDNTSDATKFASPPALGSTTRNAVYCTIFSAMPGNSTDVSQLLKSVGYGQTGVNASVRGSFELYGTYNQYSNRTSLLAAIQLKYKTGWGASSNGEAIGAIDVVLGQTGDMNTGSSSNAVVASYAIDGYTVIGKFGCNGKAAQSSFAVNAAATDLTTVVALCNQIRAGLIANGIAI